MQRDTFEIIKRWIGADAVKMFVITISKELEFCCRYEEYVLH